MLAEESLTAALEALPTAPFGGVCYRLIHPRYAETALSSIGSLRLGGRYNPQGAFEVLYLADHPVTALQEVEALLRTSAGLFPVKGPPRLLLSVEVALQSVLDLTRQDVRQALGTTLQELTGAWLPYGHAALAPTQRLGQACFAAGTLEALKVPSAREPRAFNLAVFPDRLSANSSLRVFDDSGIIAARLP